MLLVTPCPTCWCEHVEARTKLSLVFLCLSRPLCRSRAGFVCRLASSPRNRLGYRAGDRAALQVSLFIPAAKFGRHNDCERHPFFTPAVCCLWPLVFYAGSGFLPQWILSLVSASLLHGCDKKCRSL